MPSAANLTSLTWLPSGTALYTVRGIDGRLTLNAQPLDGQPFYIGIVANEARLQRSDFQCAAWLGASAAAV